MAEGNRLYNASAVKEFNGMSGSSDNMFGGSPKSWGNTVPSAPARAVNQMRIAKPPGVHNQAAVLDLTDLSVEACVVLDRQNRRVKHTVSVREETGLFAGFRRT
jgi:hypothetical protein